MRLILQAEPPPTLQDMFVMYTTSGEFSPSAYIAMGYSKMDVYVVGGGGGGGGGGAGGTRNNKVGGGGGGGGGGGALNGLAGLLLAALPNYNPIVVGPGGGGGKPGNIGISGTMSSFGDMRAYGGAAGGPGTAAVGAEFGRGGSGGGGGGVDGPPTKGWYSNFGPNTPGGRGGPGGGGSGGEGVGPYPRKALNATAARGSGIRYGGGGGGGGGHGVHASHKAAGALLEASATLGSGSLNSVAGGEQVIDGLYPSHGWGGQGAQGGGGPDLTSVTGQGGLVGDGGGFERPGSGGHGGAGAKMYGFAGRGHDGTNGCVLIRLYA